MRRLPKPSSAGIAKGRVARLDDANLLLGASLSRARQER
jgi:hypothetical protein